MFIFTDIKPDDIKVITVKQVGLKSSLVLMVFLIIKGGSRSEAIPPYCLTALCG